MEFGILIGIGINIAIVLYSFARPNILAYNRKVCVCVLIAYSIIFDILDCFHYSCHCFEVFRSRMVGFIARAMSNILLIGPHQVQDFEIRESKYIKHCNHRRTLCSFN